ncbi:unnamed protein product [Gemmataceae bacterium]|nr:unnamed protein product [Gemmataceae bacterium]VTU01271.1 unnamed protein product [Gemmataceae bacterium]
MSPKVLRIVATVALGYALALLPVVSAADEPKPASPTDVGDQKPTDWSKYSYVAEAVGEIVKADGNRLVLRVTWYETEQQRNQGGNNRNRNRRPNLSGRNNNRNYRNPYANNMNRPRFVTTEEHHDYDLEFVPESLVRNKHAPIKTNEKGERVNLNQAELNEARSPAGAPWYAASPTDLVPGTIVQVILIRDRKIPIDKVKEDDLRVKYALILGHDKTPPKEDPPKGKANTKK